MVVVICDGDRELHDGSKTGVVTGCGWDLDGHSSDIRGCGSDIDDGSSSGWWLWKLGR